MEVLEIAKKLPDDPGDVVAFEVDPDDLYPASIADVKAEVAKGLNPRELPMHLEQHYIRARRIKAEDWDAGQIPFSECPPEKAKIRNEVLEVARLWFTAKLHHEAGKKPMRLHILKNENWRLTNR